MELFGKLRANLERNKGTLAQKLMGGMGMMQKMPEGMRPRRGEGIVQGMFPRLDKRRMGRMPEPDMRTMPMMPPMQFRPKPPSKGMPIDPGRMPRFKGGGSADKYPNKGLAALAEVAPEVVKRMGYQEGGSAAQSFDDLSDYEKEMEMLKLKNVIVDMPRGYAADKTKMDFINQYGFETYTKLMEDILANERNKNAGIPFTKEEMGGFSEPVTARITQNFPRRNPQMMIDELMGAIQNGSPEEMAEKSFLLERLQEEDLSPEQQNMVFAISRMLKERNIPVGGMKVTETSVEMMPGDNISEMLANMS